MSSPDGERAPDSAASYLARCLVADHRYVIRNLPEAAPLAAVSDWILTGGDGVGLAIACIIDRDADPHKRFTLDPERVDEVAAACRKYAGSVHGVKETVTIEIWEVGAGVPDTGDRARLEGYAFRRVTQKGVAIRAYAVNTAATNGLPGDLFSTAADGATRQPWLRQILSEPRRSDQALAVAATAHDKVAHFDTRPIATYALLLAFFAMFVVELAWTVMPADGVSPGLGTLIALGGLEHERFDAGEWWRMLTCAFLHGNPLHLLFNAVAMYMAGGVLENLIGRRWMVALFVIGALGGSAASLSINADNITSVGASGAIMALLAAAMVASLRLPKGPARTQILVSLGQILIPSLLPLASAGGGKVDFAAHLGGALAGAVGGGLLLLTWARDAEHPRAGAFAAVVAAAGLAFTGYGWIRLAADHDEYARTFVGAGVLARNPALAKELIPDGELPKDDAEIAARSADLLTRYPRDPRAQYFAAVLAIEAGDVERARGHLERAIAEQDLRMLLTNPERFEVFLRHALAVTHEREDNLAAARAAAAPSCKAGVAIDDGEVRAFYERMCAAP